MAGDRFYLKARDTLPVLEVALKDPDGTAHDLTGADAVWLHVSLPGGTFSREMTVDDATGGIVSYAWVPTDWTVAPALAAYPVPYRMEYEVIDGTDHLTFPNDGYDELVVASDIGQAS